MKFKLWTLWIWKIVLGSFCLKTGRGPLVGRQHYFYFILSQTFACSGPSVHSKTPLQKKLLRFELRWGQFKNHMDNSKWLGDIATIISIPRNTSKVKSPLRLLILKENQRIRDPGIAREPKKSWGLLWSHIGCICSNLGQWYTHLGQTE